MAHISLIISSLSESVYTLTVVRPDSHNKLDIESSCKKGFSAGSASISSQANERTTAVHEPFDVWNRNMRDLVETWGWKIGGGVLLRPLEVTDR